MARIKHVKVWTRCMLFDRATAKPTGFTKWRILATFFIPSDATIFADATKKRSPHWELWVQFGDFDKPKNPKKGESHALVS